MEFINYSNISLGKEAIAVPIAIGRIETNFLAAFRYSRLAIGIARGKAKNHSK